MKSAQLFKNVRDRVWRLDANFGYLLFAVALLWLSGLATLEYISERAGVKSIPLHANLSTGSGRPPRH
jgi:hypothetical protein